MKLFNKRTLIAAALATATAARAREYARERACARRDHHTTQMSDTEQGRNP